MWSSWYIVGLLMLVTKRYAKKHWLFMHYLHAILGYYALIVTIIFSLSVAEFEFKGLHKTLGLIFLPIAILGSLSGTFTAGTMKAYNGDKDWAEKERVERIAKIHRISGYVMLFFGCICVTTGIGYYFGHKLEGDDREILAPINMASFFFLVIVFEAIYRIRNKYSLGHVKTPKVQANHEYKSYTPE